MTWRRAHHIGALGAMTQGLIDQHQGQHGLGNRRRADAHAGVVSTVRSTTTAGWPARVTERRGRRMLEVGLIGQIDDQSWPRGNAAEHTAGMVAEESPAVSSRRHARCPSGTLAKPAPISTPLTALMPIIA
jgi:hypothetical protein